jgi:hypothetical protein
MEAYEIDSKGCEESLICFSWYRPLGINDVPIISL